jgi:hypothetical protein
VLDVLVPKIGLKGAGIVSLVGQRNYHAQPEKWEQFCSAHSAELTAEPAVSATKTLLVRSASLGEMSLSQR